MNTDIQALLDDPLAQQLAIAVLGIVIVWLIIRVLNNTFTQRIESAEARYRMRKVTSLGAYIIIALFLLYVFAEQLQAVTVVLGVASAGIAFALQEVIVSFAGWIAISFGSFYNVGDRVKLGGIMGDVIDVNFLRTTIMECGGWLTSDAHNGRIVRVSNGFVFKEPVYNYSAEFPFLWDEIKLPVRYGSDYRQARAILEKVAEETVGEYAADAIREWDDIRRRYLIKSEDMKPTVSMVANDNWIEFTLRYVVDYRSRLSIKDALFTNILNQIDAAGGAVELGSATFELVAAPEVQVRLEEEYQSTMSRPKEDD